MLQKVFLLTLPPSCNSQPHCLLKKKLLKEVNFWTRNQSWPQVISKKSSPPFTRIEVLKIETWTFQLSMRCSVSSKGEEVLQPKFWRLPPIPILCNKTQIENLDLQYRIKSNILQNRMHTLRAMGYHTQATGKMQGGNSSKGGTKLHFTKRNQQVFLKEYWETSSTHFSNF